MGTLTNLISTEAWRIASSIHNALLDANLQANICVVNRNGRPLCEITMDEARPFTVSVAFHKAQQAALVGRRTRWIRDQVASGEIGLDVLGIDPAKFIKWAGGAPIYNDQGVLLGGAGVSNLIEDQDEMFCVAGIEACHYSSECDQPPPHNRRNIVAVHHVAISLPHRKMIKRFVKMLQEYDAVIVSADDKRCSYCLRLNPWDKTLLKVFLEEEKTGIDFHVNITREDCSAVQLTAYLFKDFGTPGTVFESVVKEKVENNI